MIIRDILLCVTSIQPICVLMLYLLYLLRYLQKTRGVYKQHYQKLVRSWTSSSRAWSCPPSRTSTAPMVTLIMSRGVSSLHLQIRIISRHPASCCSWCPSPSWARRGPPRSFPSWMASRSTSLCFAAFQWIIWSYGLTPLTPEQSWPWSRLWTGPRLSWGTCQAHVLLQIWSTRFLVQTEKTFTIASSDGLRTWQMCQIEGTGLFFQTSPRTPWWRSSWSWAWARTWRTCGCHWLTFGKQVEQLWKDVVDSNKDQFV